MGVPSFAALPHLPAQGKGDEIPERGERTQSGEDEVRGALLRALRQRQRHRQQHEQVARRAQQPCRADGDDVVREKPRRLARAQLRRGRGQQAERGKARDQVRQPEAERVAPAAGGQTAQKIVRLIRSGVEKQARALVPVLALIDEKLKGVSRTRQLI